MKIPIADKKLGQFVFSTPKLKRWRGNEANSTYDFKIERYNITKRTNWQTDGTVSAAALNLVITRKGNFTKNDSMSFESTIIALGNHPPNTTDQSLKELLLDKVKQDMTQRKYTYTREDKDYNISPNNQSTITLA